MADKISMWKAGDGRVFKTEKEAQVHEHTARVMKAVRIPNHVASSDAYSLFSDAFSRGLILLPYGVTDA